MSVDADTLPTMGMLEYSPKTRALEQMHEILQYHHAAPQTRNQSGDQPRALRYSHSSNDTVKQ